MGNCSASVTTTWVETPDGSPRLHFELVQEPSGELELVQNGAGEHWGEEFDDFVAHHDSKLRDDKKSKCVVSIKSGWRIPVSVIYQDVSSLRLLHGRPDLPEDTPAFITYVHYYIRESNSAELAWMLLNAIVDAFSERGILVWGLTSCDYHHNLIQDWVTSHPDANRPVVSLIPTLDEYEQMQWHHERGADSMEYQERVFKLSTAHRFFAAELQIPESQTFTAFKEEISHRRFSLVLFGSGETASKVAMYARPPNPRALFLDSYLGTLYNSDDILAYENDGY